MSKPKPKEADYGHAGRPGEVGGSAPGSPQRKIRTDFPAPGTDTKVRARKPQTTIGPLDPHEIEIGKRMDRGEVRTEAMGKDGKMHPMNWPDDENW